MSGHVSCPSCEAKINPKDFEDDFIPKSRFDSLNDEKKDLASKVRDLSGQLKDAQQTASLAEKHAARAAELEGELASTKNFHAAELALTNFGVDQDPDVRNGFFDLYNKIEGDEKPAFSDWFKGLQENPESAPVLLRAFVPPSAEAQAEAQQAQPQFRKPAPTTVNTTNTDTTGTVPSIINSIRDNNGNPDIAKLRDGGLDRLYAAAGMTRSER